MGVTTNHETPRLRMRRFTADDLAPLSALNADPVVMEHFPSTQSPAETQALIDRIERHFDDHGFSLWALEVKDTGEMIGFTGLITQTFEAHFTPAVEIGWRLARHSWRQGYATEAAREALRIGFVEHALEEIVSMTTTTNVPSQAVMRAIGMTHDPADDFDHPRVPDGSPLKRHVLYRLSRQDWERTI